jgi:hypothetical protein
MTIRWTVRVVSTDVTEGVDASMDAAPGVGASTGVERRVQPGDCPVSSWKADPAAATDVVASVLTLAWPVRIATECPGSGG